MKKNFEFNFFPYSLSFLYDCEYGDYGKWGSFSLREKIKKDQCIIIDDIDMDGKYFVQKQEGNKFFLDFEENFKRSHNEKKEDKEFFIELFEENNEIFFKNQDGNKIDWKNIYIESSPDINASNYLLYIPYEFNNFVKTMETELYKERIKMFHSFSTEIFLFLIKEEDIENTKKIINNLYEKYLSMIQN